MSKYLFITLNSKEFMLGLTKKLENSIKEKAGAENAEISKLVITNGLGQIISAHYCSFLHILEQK